MLGNSLTELAEATGHLETNHEGQPQRPDHRAQLHPEVAIPHRRAPTRQGQERPKFRFVQDFHAFHGVSRQTFAKYYNRHRESGDANALLPAKRGPRWKSRRTPPFIERLVLEQRRKGVNRYETYAILLHKLGDRAPKPPPSTPSANATASTG